MSTRLINDRGKRQEANTSYLSSKENTPYLWKHAPQDTLIKAFLHWKDASDTKTFKPLEAPIIGDRPHGCNKQNKLFKDRWNHTEMLLHCRTIKIKNPETNTPQTIEAPFPESFEKIAKELLINLNALQLDS